MTLVNICILKTCLSFFSSSLHLIIWHSYYLIAHLIVALFLLLLLNYWYNKTISIVIMVLLPFCSLILFFFFVVSFGFWFLLWWSFGCSDRVLVQFYRNSNCYTLLIWLNITKFDHRDRGKKLYIIWNKHAHFYLLF